MAPSFPGEATSVVADSYWSRFSPDGKTILLLSADARVLTAKINQGKPAEVEAINREYRVDAAPLWSGTGENIVFLGHRKGEPEKSGR